MKTTSATRELPAQSEPPAPGGAMWSVSVAPNWFAAVMGTGILANALVGLPLHSPMADLAARVIWSLALALLIMLVIATAIHWHQHPAIARSHRDHPIMAHFYGAPAMAFLTVGAGSALIGIHVMGSLAVPLGALLALIGTALGIRTAVGITGRAFTHHRNDSGVTPAWLMSIVPPMVSAATGPVFLTFVDNQQARLTLLILCCVFFGMTLFPAVIIVGLLWQRLMHDHLPAPAMVPLLWIVLGPLGQSITAAEKITDAAQTLLPTEQAQIMRDLGLAYGLVTWGFALLWLMLAVTITVRTARNGLPFSLAWWAFTFPLGTMVTGTSLLATHTHADFLAGLSILFFVGLTGLWLLVACRTAQAVINKSLFTAPSAPSV